MNFLKNFWKDESGQALSEYGVILGIVLVGVITVIIAFRDQIQNVFETIINSLNM
ncbi:Flp family type IVb pilin [Alteribacter lacisalsi]|uniref:Flp family type IVb pilin n=1 Tax=Alteribacter lacisalsi TaxID=2045244 RepID=A0A2W0H5C2_9BACI|nr:Flp family type IVb pilin [Alteribacter lacisalsi]PYZ97033.1 Flp family type IVb pilin [Alteribacter lacisalsi]